MNPPKSDPTKLPDMVMCGDHPSITKTELNIKEENVKPEDKSVEHSRSKECVKVPLSYAKLSPSSSHTEKAVDLNARATSDHTLRLIEARRRMRSMEAVPAGEFVSPGNKALVQAALGSFRWPPYLVGVWVLVLLLTHALHCLVAVLDTALPNLKKFCQYLRQWTEEAWKCDCERSKVFPLSLACVTGVMYMFYFTMYASHSLALWAIEPLCDDDKRDDIETKVTNYLDEDGSKTNSNYKQS